MTTALTIAAALLLAVAIAHSWLGERYVLQRLFRRAELPRLFGSVEYFQRVMRYAWHLTSVAWLGLAAVLVLLAHPPASAAAIAWVVAATFAIHGAVTLLASRGRHLAWIPFFAVTSLAVFAAYRA